MILLRIEQLGKWVIHAQIAYLTNNKHSNKYIHRTHIVQYTKVLCKFSDFFFQIRICKPFLNFDYSVKTKRCNQCIYPLLPLSPYYIYLYPWAILLLGALLGFTVFLLSSITSLNIRKRSESIDVGFNLLNFGSTQCSAMTRNRT